MSPSASSSEAIPQYVSDPEKWIHDIGHVHEILCLVIFRGSWCPFDQQYLKLLGDSKPSNCFLVAWTSQGEEAAREVEDKWNLPNVNMVIGDKTAALAKYFIEDEILPELTIQPIREELKHKHSLGDDEYPEGLVQPGMVIFAHKGNLIMHWEAPVTEANGYGAANRPEMDGT
jgi:hypothetical protein